jgi:hypothetical protein
VAAAVALALSVTVTEKLVVTAVVGGSPLSVPLVLNCNHEGKLEPDVTDHE